MRVPLIFLLHFIGFIGFGVACYTNRPAVWEQHAMAVAQAQRHWVVAQDLCEAAQEKMLEQYGLFDWPQDCVDLEWL